MFSKACEYGIRATLFIAEQSLLDNRVSLKGISGSIGSPEAFTAKILQLLVKEGIIISVKGATGGFEIRTEEMDKIPLSRIVAAIDGDGIYKGCGLGLKDCNEKEPCPLHDKFSKIRNDLRSMLETTSVFEMSLGLKEGLTCLNRISI